ncbi:restriction endonuclease subunit S [Methanosarcina sp. WH1]|uniref:restriction endonuclease subunit S n=1 Tax=Methanosarcina sp. WH1 TaxID=1434102 RepID=UPI000615C813|nr:restriction endonuclease subunit S [Methanosarcina sp. WH1]AKB21734.1 Type I restriction-modification system, specificity subunit S [Methanosarcina sp. WH1]
MENKNVKVPNGYKKTELGVIPEEWEVGELGTCIKQVKESVLPESTGKTIYVGLEHISSGETKLTNYGRSDSVKSLKFKFTKNNILYGKLRPYLDKAVLTDKEGICSTDIIVIECKDSSIKEFVIYILHSKQFLDYINGTTAGSNLPRTSWQSISKYKVPLPPFSEQQKIASILSKVDEQIEQTEQIIEKTEILKKGLMQKLLTKGIEHTTFKEIKIGTKYYNIPITWEVRNIESTFLLKGRIGWQGLTTKEYLNEGNYCLVTGTDFERGRINWDTCVYVSEERYLQDSNIQLKDGDILVTKDGTIGKIAYVDKLENLATLNSGIFVLRSLNNGCYPEYLYNILNSFYFELFISVLKAGSTISHLYQKDFTKFSFPLPPLPEQQKIASILSKVDSQIQDNQSYLHKLQELKKGLMQDLLTGNVRVCV